MLSSCRRCLPAIRGNSYRLSNDPCLLSLYNNIDLYDLNNLTFVCVCHNRIHKATFLPAKQQVLSNQSLHKYEEFQSATIMRSKKQSHMRILSAYMSIKWPIALMCPHYPQLRKVRGQYSVESAKYSLFIVFHVRIVHPLQITLSVVRTPVHMYVNFIVYRSSELFFIGICLCYLLHNCIIKV